MHIFAGLTHIVWCDDFTKNRLESILSYPHAWIELDRNLIYICDLESDSSLEPWIQKSGCRVYDESESAQ